MLLITFGRQPNQGMNESTHQSINHSALQTRAAPGTWARAPETQHALPFLEMFGRCCIDFGATINQLNE